MSAPFSRFRPTILTVTNADNSKRHFLLKPSPLNFFNISALHQIPIDSNSPLIANIFAWLEHCNRHNSTLMSNILRNSYYWISKASYFELLGKQEEAIKTYEHAITYDPQPQEALTLAFQYFLLRIGAACPDKQIENCEEAELNRYQMNDSPEKLSHNSINSVESTTDSHSVTSSFLPDTTGTDSFNEYDPICASLKSKYTASPTSLAEPSVSCDKLIERIDSIEDEIITNSSYLATNLNVINEGTTNEIMPTVPTIFSTPSKLAESPAYRQIQNERKFGLSPLVCKRKLFTDSNELHACAAEKRSKDSSSSLFNMPYEDGGFDSLPLNSEISEHNQLQHPKSLPSLSMENHAPSISAQFSNRQNRLSEHELEHEEEQNVVIKYALMRTPKKIQQLTHTPLILSPVKRLVRTPQPTSKRCIVFDTVGEIPSELQNYYYIPNESLQGGKPLKATTVLNRFLKENQNNSAKEETEQDNQSQ